jgi:hypothetical protein
MRVTTQPSAGFQGSQRTGPFGRLARLVLATIFALSLLSIVDSRGSARFRNPHILSEPAVWFLNLLIAAAFVILVGAIAAALAGHQSRRRCQVGAVIGLLATVAASAGYGELTQGAAWGFPLADLVWWFDVLVLVQLIIAELLAVAFGTRGCEIGVWPELPARARGGHARSEDTLACLFGLHLIDAWEARRG